MSITKTILYRQLHGSISEVYQDLPGSDIPAALNDAIPTAAVEILAYQDRNTPRNHSFLRIRAGRKDLALRAMCAQKHSSIAQTCYAQKYLLELTPQLLLENFEDLLGIGFHTEEGFNLAATNAHSAPRDYSWSSGGTCIPIDPDVLKAVLFGMVNRWRRGSDPVVIAVPDDADYDRYTCAAVSAIYACLPAALRLLAGFMTYADPGTQSSGVTLFFLPASRNYPGAVFLDGTGSSSITKNLLGIEMPAELKTMLSELAAMSDADRRQSLKDIADYVESAEDSFVDLGKLHWRNYTTYWSLRGLSNLDPGNAADFESLKKFAASANSVPDTQKAALSKIIREQVTTAHLDEYFLNHAKTATDAGCFYKLVLPYLPLCAMAGTADTSGVIRSSLEAHVWNAFWCFCADLAAAQTDMDGLNRLHEAVAEVIRNRDNAGTTAAIEVEEPYRTAFSNRKTDFLKDELDAAESQLHQDIRQKCTVLGKNPDDAYKALTDSFLKSLPDGLTETDELVIQVLERAQRTHQEARTAFALKLTKWFDLDLNPDPDTITRALCDKLDETVKQKQETEVFKTAPKDIQTAVARHCREKGNQLRQSLSKSRGYYDEIRKELTVSGTNYFQRLKALAREQQQQTLSEQDCDSLYKDHLSRFRPENLEKYTAAFRDCYGSNMSIANVAPLGDTLGSYIARDLNTLCDPDEPHIIVLTNKSLSQLAEDVLTKQILQNYLTGAGTTVVLKSHDGKLTINANTLKITLNGFLGRRPFAFKCEQQELRSLVVLLTKSGAITHTDFPRVLAYLKANADSAPDGHWAKVFYSSMLQKYLTITAYDCTPADLESYCQTPGSRQKPLYRSPEQYYQVVAEYHDVLTRTGMLDDQTQLYLQYLESNGGLPEQVTLRQIQFPLNMLYNTLRFYLRRNSPAQDLLPAEQQDQLLPLVINGAGTADFPALTNALLNLHHRYHTMRQTKVHFDHYAYTCIGHFFLDHDADEETRLDMYQTLKAYSRYSDPFFLSLPKNTRNPDNADRVRRFIHEYQNFCKVFTYEGNHGTYSGPFAEGAGVRNKIRGLFRRSHANGSDADPDTAPEPEMQESHAAKRRRWLVIPVLLAALLLVGLLVWGLYPGIQDPDLPTGPSQISTEAGTSTGTTTEPVSEPAETITEPQAPSGTGEPSTGEPSETETGGDSAETETATGATAGSDEEAGEG